jgi:hypothetical protein
MSLQLSHRADQDEAAEVSLERWGYSADGSIRTGVDKTKHLLRLPPALCWTQAAIDKAIQSGCSILRAEFTDGDIWTVTLERFMRLAVPIQRPGTEAQRFLPVEHWSKRYDHAGKGALELF